MPRRGVHPLLSTVTVVLRSGASVRVATARPAGGAPVMLSVDPTVHPRWTGDAAAVSAEDGRLAKFAKKYAGGLGSGGGVGGGAKPAAAGAGTPAAPK